MQTPTLIAAAISILSAPMLHAAPNPGDEQVAEVVQIYVQNAGGERDTLTFGVMSGASRGIDGELGESEYPPYPPEEIFEARFINVPPSSDLGLGVVRDLRAYTDKEQADTFRLRFQAGAAGYPVTISWNAIDPKTAQSMTIRSGGETIDMLTATSITIDDDGVQQATIIKSGSSGTSTVATSVNEAGFYLQQVMPNPVRRDVGTTITFGLPRGGRATMALFDALGREVARPISEQYRDAGEHSVRLNTTSLEAGTYYYTLTAGALRLTRSLVVLD